MGADHFAGRFQFGPDAGMFQSGYFRVRNNWQSVEDAAEVAFTAESVRRCCSFDAVLQLRYRDGGNLKLLIRARVHPLRDVEGAFLVANDHRVAKIQKPHPVAQDPTRVGHSFFLARLSIC